MKLQLYYPIKPYKINQNFGNNDACAEDKDILIEQRKIIGKTFGVCPPGYIELYPLLGMKGHTGTDLKATHGQPLYHCGPDGVVAEVQTEVERGLGLGIVSNDDFEIGDVKSKAKIRYWHLKGFNVKFGDQVKLGDLIGWCDNTGLSSGDHLHLELKPVMKNSIGSYYNLLQNNGYFGSIDPEPYFNGLYAQMQQHITPTALFEVDMRYGQSSEDVKRLQKVLTELGYFTYPELTGNYRDITREAVYNFQKDFTSLSFFEDWILKGRTCGPKTRSVLNKIISNSK